MWFSQHLERQVRDDKSFVLFVEGVEVFQTRESSRKTKDDPTDLTCFDLGVLDFRDFQT